MPNDQDRPRYGELAPEGWEWKPEGETEAAPQRSASPHQSGPVAGVPHNLGARGDSAPGTPAQHGSTQAGPAAPAAPRQPSGDPEPYRAAPPQGTAQGQPVLAQAAPPAPQTAGARSRNRADFVITIVLLVIGGFGALYLALSMQQLSTSLALIGEVLGLDGFTVPGWVGVVGVVSAIGYLALFAVTLIWSIQRLRANRIAFWIPLAAGALAVAALLIVSLVVMMNVPDLMQALSDPASTQKMLEYLSSMEQ